MGKSSASKGALLFVEAFAGLFDLSQTAHAELLERVDGLTKEEAEAALKYLRQQLRRSQTPTTKSKRAWILLFTAMVQRGQHLYSAVLKLVGEARGLFETLDDKFGLACATLEVSLSNRELDRNTLALQYAQEAINLLQMFAPSIELAWAYSNLATIYINRSQPKEGFSSAQKAHEIFQQLKAQDGFAWNACNLASLYLEMGESEKSLELYQSALQTFTASNNHQGIGWSSLGLSTVHRRRCQFQQALQYVEKAQQIFEKLKLTDRIGWCMLHRAALLRGHAREKEALELNAKVMKIFTPAKNLDGVAWCHFQNAQILRDQAQPIKAWQEFQQALELHEHVYNRFGVAWDLNEIGKTYLGLNNIALANESLTRAKSTAYQMNLPSLKADVEKNFANMYLDQGMIEKARESLELAEGFCAHAEAFETRSEICLSRTRYSLLTMNFPAAHVSIKHGQVLCDTYGFSRLNPMFDMYRGELFLMEGKIDEAETCFNNALAFAKKHDYRYLFLKVPLGFIQIHMARKQVKKTLEMFGPLEKAIKSWGARKLRAKLLALRTIANAQPGGVLDPTLIRQSLLILDLNGFLLTKLQFLELFESAADKIGDKAAMNNFMVQREQLLKRAPSDLRNLSPRKSVLEMIPVSLAS